MHIGSHAIASDAPVFIVTELSGNHSGEKARAGSFCQSVEVTTYWERGVPR
jgi:sialic acid synthase SpsE